MRKFFLVCLIVISGISLYSQVSIVRSDFVDVNDSIPRVYYSFENDMSSFPASSVMPTDMVFDDPTFPIISIDTLVYFPSSETDPEGLFPNATCAFNTRDGFVMHLKITDTNVELIGMQGQLPFTGDIMNLKFVDNLIMAEFPSDYNDQIIDQGVGYDKQPISMFQSMIPADTYAQLTMVFDTVRFFMDMKIKSSFDEQGEIQFVGDSNQNGTFQYLRENRKIMTSFDVQLRNKFSGTFTSLSNIPGVAEQLPMELPMIDTSRTHFYWVKDMKSPLLEIEYNASYDSIYNMTFRYAYLSYVNSSLMTNLEVYPNPASEIINFNLENSNGYSVAIFSTDGRLVSILKLESDNTSLNLSKFTQGTYIYQIFDKNKVPVAGGKFSKN